MLCLQTAKRVYKNQRKVYENVILYQNYPQVTPPTVHALASISGRHCVSGLWKTNKFGWNCSESGLRWKVKLDPEWGIYLMLSFPTRSPKPFFELSDKFYICSDVSLLLHQHEQKTCSVKKYLSLALCHIYRSSQKLDLRKLILQRFCGVFIDQSPHNCESRIHVFATFVPWLLQSIISQNAFNALLFGVFPTSRGLSMWSLEIVLTKLIWLSSHVLPQKN